MKCAKCGKMNEQSSNYCIYCGNKIGLSPDLPDKPVDSTQVPPIDPVVPAYDNNPTQVYISKTEEIPAEVSTPQEDKSASHFSINTYLKNKMIVSGVIVVVCVLLLGSGVWAYKFFFDNPLRILNSGLTNLDNANSVTVTYTPNTALVGFPTLKLSYFKNTELYSGLQVSFPTPKTTISELDGTLVNAVYNKDGLYLSLMLPNGVLDSLNSYTDQLNTLSSGSSGTPFTSSQFEKDLMSIMQGQAWLAVNYNDLSSLYKQYSGSNLDTVNSKTNTSQENQVESLLSSSYKVNSYNSSFSYNGKVYKQITVGFDKTKLVTALNKLKSIYDQTLPQTQSSSYDSSIDQFNKELSSVKNLDDVFEVLLDNNNDIYLVTINIPKSLCDQSGNTLCPATSGASLSLGTIKFENYNNVKSVIKPTNTIDFTKLETEFTTAIPSFNIF